MGGTATSTHLELDANEIIAKSNGTSTTDLFLNTDGGTVYTGGNLRAKGSTISLKAPVTKGTTPTVEAGAHIDILENTDGLAGENRIGMFYLKVFSS